MAPLRPSLKALGESPPLTSSQGAAKTRDPCLVAAEGWDRGIRMEGSRVTKEASGHTPQASRGTLEGSKDTRDEGYTGGEHQTRQDKTRQDSTQRNAHGCTGRLEESTNAPLERSRRHTGRVEEGHTTVGCVRSQSSVVGWGSLNGPPATTNRTGLSRRPAPTACQRVVRTTNRSHEPRRT